VEKAEDALDDVLLKFQRSLMIACDRLDLFGREIGILLNSNKLVTDNVAT
jgi:hypothetical protein